MDSLTPFSYGLGRVHRHDSRASFVGPRLYSYDASIGFSHVVPLRDSRHFSNDHTRYFPCVNISRHVSKEAQRLHFQTKICILLTLVIS
jgi:hypothetical protein